MTLLTLEGVSKAFAGVRAVRDVSFAVPAGAVVGVMGPNGSGKTTLFNLISGAIRPDQGRIRVGDADVTGLPPHRVCRHGIARTFQHVRPFPGLSALDNVLVGQLYGRRRARGAVAVAASASWASERNLPKSTASNISRVLEIGPPSDSASHAGGASSQEPSGLTSRCVYTQRLRAVSSSRWEAVRTDTQCRVAFGAAMRATSPGCWGRWKCRISAWCGPRRTRP